MTLVLIEEEEEKKVIIVPNTTYYVCENSYHADIFLYMTWLYILRFHWPEYIFCVSEKIKLSPQYSELLLWAKLDRGVHSENFP